jgi:hypothetical protein
MKIGKWTIVVNDKLIIKQYGNFKGYGYFVNEENFWKTSIENNIRAIQYTGDNLDFEQVEFSDGKDHDFFKGDINIFVKKWEELHLKKLQLDWDLNNLINQETQGIIIENSEQKTARIGERPIQYNVD